MANKTVMCSFLLGMQPERGVLRKYLKVCGSRALPQTAQSSITPFLHFISFL